MRARDHQPVKPGVAHLLEQRPRHPLLALDLFPELADRRSHRDGGLHHLPVLDAHDRLVGMITQSDMVAALFLLQPGMAQAMQGAPLRRRAPAQQPA